MNDNATHHTPHPHTLLYAATKLACAVWRLDRVPPDAQDGAPMAHDATLVERLAAAFADALPIWPDDMPDDECVSRLAKLKSWKRALAFVCDEGARLAAAREAERVLRDLAGRLDLAAVPAKGR